MSLAGFVHDVAEFQALGQIVIMGDLNAHTGSASDVEGQEAWEEAHADTMPLAAMLRMRILLQELQKHTPRASQDRSAIDRTGDQLLSLCKDHGLAILNGRLPGDTQGCTTHVGVQYDRTLLDYIIVSPRLAFSMAGTPLPGCWLKVWGGGDVASVPPNPSTHKVFDHVPVGARFRLIVPGAGAKPKPLATGEVHGPASVRWAWRPELQEPWTAMLCSDAHMA